MIGLYHMDTEGWTRLHCCIHHERTCRYSDTCQIHQSQLELEFEMGTLQGQDEGILSKSIRDNILA